MKTRLAAGLLLCVLQAAAQEFEVASIKPSAPGQQFGGIRPMPGDQRYVATNVTLRLIMTVAYSVTDRQISGGPAWINEDRFDIDAKAEKPGSIDDLHLMLQHLLEERFQLKVRHESREMPVWNMVIDKVAKLPEHDRTDRDYPPMALSRTGLKGTNVTTNYFAFILSRLLDRTVIDKTELPARYDVNVEFTLDQPGGPAKREGGGETPVVPEGPDIFSALRQQLGLRLIAGRGPVDFLAVVDAQKPSGN